MDFEGQPQVGEIICNQTIAQDLVEIFYELYQASYPIERIRLIDEYGGDDTLSMEANNTSCFNYQMCIRDRWPAFFIIFCCAGWG